MAQTYDGNAFIQLFHTGFMPGGSKSPSGNNSITFEPILRLFLPFHWSVTPIYRTFYYDRMNEARAIADQGLQGPKLDPCKHAACTGFRLNACFELQVFSNPLAERTV